MRLLATQSVEATAVSDGGDVGAGAETAPAPSMTTTRTESSAVHFVNASTMRRLASVSRAFIRSGREIVSRATPLSSSDSITPGASCAPPATSSIVVFSLTALLTLAAVRICGRRPHGTPP